MKARIPVTIAFIAAALLAPAAQAQQGAGSGEIVIPGGERFIRAVIGLGAPNPDIERGADFLILVAQQLSAPLTVDFSRRLGDQVDELRRLQRFLAELDAEYGDVAPSIAEPGSTAHTKATRLLDFLGFTIVDNGERVQLQRRVSDQAARRRRLLEQLGISVPLQSRLWAAGEPMVFDISDERAPLLFGAQAWNEQVFEEALDGEELFNAFVADDAARRVLSGYAALDEPTRAFLFREVGLAPLHRNEETAAGFMQVAPYLRAIDGELLLPGADRDAWEAILEPWAGTTQLLDTLVTRNNGRAAHLWRALALVPEPLARYLLTMGYSSAAERAAWAESLYGEIRMPGFGTSIRWPEDIAELFVNLRLNDDGSGIAWPGGGPAWLAALADDEPLVADGALDELFQTLAATPASGPAIDSRILLQLLDQTDPNRSEPTAIRKFIAVSAALRYQPESSLRRAVPLLFRDYERFGRSYGFFVTPTPLPADAALLMLRNLHQVDGIDDDGARVDAIRQLQATLMLMHRMMLNDLLTDDDREALLTGFFNLPLVSGAGRDSAATEGYGNALTEWWRTELIPGLARGLTANGWPGDPTDTRAVLVTALIGRIGMSPIEIDGIDYNFAPASTLGERMYIHLLTQQQPSFVSLFRLDEIAEALQTGTVDARFADEIESHVADLEAQMPPNIGDAEINEALPVTVSRSALFESAATLVAELRLDNSQPVTVRAFRAAVSAYMGDALSGIAYALYMGDPRSFTYQQGHIAWLHRLEIADLPDGAPDSLFGPWAATSESWIMDEGSRLHNSLFGAPDTVSRWNLENSMGGGNSRDPAAAEAWAATLGHIHIPSLTPEAQRVIAQRYDLASSWIESAVDARDPELVPAFWVTANPARQPPTLATTLRRVMHPYDVQRFADAVVAGRRAEALRLVTAGNRYLLLRLLDDNDVAAPAAARWLIDQAVGMPVLRRGDYLGLLTPPPVPHGEAGDNLADALLYTRLFDVRVQLAVLMEEQGLPAALHARLLSNAMAQVLSTMRPGAWDTWRNILAAINEQVTEASLKQWVVDLAFADELTPTDPTLAMERSGATAAGPAGNLVLPVDISQYQAAFGAEINMITIDVGVWDDDEFVADLTADDFTIERDGVPITPAYVRLEGSPQPSIFLDDLPDAVAENVTPSPRNFVLVADMLTTSPQDWNRILLDVTEFVRAGINVEDNLALVTIDNRGVPTINHDFTQEHERVAETLEAQIGNAFETMDLEQSFNDLTNLLCDNGMCIGEDVCEPLAAPRFQQCITQNGDWEERKFQMAQAQLGRWAIDAEIRSQRIMAALTQVGSMLELGDPMDRQKILLLMSSGFERLPGNIHYQTLVEYANYSPALNPMEIRRISNDVSHQLVDLTDIMRRCRCTIYALGTLGNAMFSGTSVVTSGPPVITRTQARSGLQGALNGLARDTGGTPFFGSDLSVGFTDVLEDTRLRYIIGFVMDEDVDPDADAEWIELDVKVNRNGVDVRSREGFYWPRR